MPQVRVAKHSGFCYGVKRAIDMALQAAQENGEVYSYGPLIHNPEAVSDLHSQGITVIDSLDEVSKGVASVSLETEIPVLFGVVTTENIEQAIERAGTKAGNKGYDCALSAIEMINLMKQI